MAGVLESKGNFDNFEKFLKAAMRPNVTALLHKYGKAGVEALSSSTPVDSGDTAAGWSYEIKNGRGKYEIVFKNSHIHNGIPVAILIQYGHGTGTGGYVRGTDFINPAMRSTFQGFADDIWKVVSRSGNS